MAAARAKTGVRAKMVLSMMDLEEGSKVLECDAVVVVSWAWFCCVCDLWKYEVGGKQARGRVSREALFQGVVAMCGVWCVVVSTRECGGCGHKA